MFTVGGKELGEVPLLHLLLHCYQQYFMLPTTVMSFCFQVMNMILLVAWPVMGCLFHCSFILQPVPVAVRSATTHLLRSWV